MIFQKSVWIAAISTAYSLSPLQVAADEFDVSISGQLTPVLAELGDPAGLDGAQIDLVTSFDGCSAMERRMGNLGFACRGCEVNV